MENTKEKEFNVRLYPYYKMFSWDLLFYYCISFLFLTQAKHISAADVVLSDSLYPIFKFILLIPLTMLIEKLGKRKSLIIANFINALSIISVLLAQNFVHLILVQFLSALAFGIKALSETNLLYDSLPKDENRGKRFSKIDGRGNSLYYYINATAAVLSGFLFVVNPYIPVILTCAMCLFSTFISYKFKEIKTQEKVEKISVKQYMKDLKYSFKYMFQSERLRYLLVFGSIISGFLGVLVSLRSGILQQIQVPDQYFGVIFAVMEIVSGIAVRNQSRFHERFRNKTLAVIGIPITVSCILLGFTVMAKIPYEITVICILLLFFVQYVMNGPFQSLIKRYLNNFTTTSLRNKIISSYSLTESIARACISLLASALLRITVVSNTVLVLGCIMTIIVVLLLDKMSRKVGLKPEEYEKSEIEFAELK